MSEPDSGRRRAPFVAYVYENDYEEIQNLVQLYPNIETGGDLFGLWKDERTVIIQQFIGPGKDCKRTTTSFHQDIEYLHRVGSLITTEEGLCNVGEWHSHHQIGMPEPSGPDRRTVFSNMPHLGLERFVLFIATIEGKGFTGKKRLRDVELRDIKLRPFLFLGSSQDVVKGEIQKIPGANPHRRSNRIIKEIENGAEKKSLEDNGRATKKSERKKKAGEGEGKPAQDEAEKENKSSTLQQQPNELASSRQPQREQFQTPRETKAQCAEVTKRFIDDRSLGRKLQGNQQREKKEEQTQSGDNFSNENLSPNTGTTASGGRDYQSPHASPTPQMNAPQHIQTASLLGMPPTTSAGSFKKVWDASLHPGANQGQGPHIQGNGSIPTNSVFPHGAGYSSPQNQLHPDYTGGQGNSRGNMPHQSYADQRGKIPIDEMTAKGMF